MTETRTYVSYDGNGSSEMLRQEEQERERQRKMRRSGWWRVICSVKVLVALLVVAGFWTLIVIGAQGGLVQGKEGGLRRRTGGQDLSGVKQSRAA